MLDIEKLKHVASGMGLRIEVSKDTPGIVGKSGQVTSFDDLIGFFETEVQSLNNDTIWHSNLVPNEIQSMDLVHTEMKAKLNVLNSFDEFKIQPLISKVDDIAFNTLFNGKISLSQVTESSDEDYDFYKAS